MHRQDPVVRFEGELPLGVTAKDAILGAIGRIGVAGGVGEADLLHAVDEADRGIFRRRGRLGLVQGAPHPDQQAIPQQLEQVEAGLARGWGRDKANAVEASLLRHTHEGQNLAVGHGLISPELDFR